MPGNPGFAPMPSFAPKPVNPLERYGATLEILLNASNEIKSEHLVPPNSWYSTLHNHLLLLEEVLEDKKVVAHLLATKPVVYESLKQRLATVREKITAIGSEYPDREHDAPIDLGEKISTEIEALAKELS